MKLYLKSIIWTLVAAAAIQTGQAAEFCVTCTGPEANYVCSLDGQATNSGLKLYCMSELAKAGGHASCSVARTQKTRCEGETKRLPMPAGYEIGPETTPADAQSGAETAVAPSSPATPAGGETTLPKSSHSDADAPQRQSSPGVGSEDNGVASGAEGTTDQSAVQKAGKAIGKAAQKTWTCLTSLFGDC